MGKQTTITYKCDRCGKIIDEANAPVSIGRFKYLHILKWWIPQPTNMYKLHYICGDCFRSFKSWYKNEVTQ